MKSDITTIVLTKNSKKTIKSCLQSVKNFSQEILIIDDFSTDSTINIAKKAGARVIKHTLENFSKQRNFGLEKAKCNWVFFLDSDELITNTLKAEIIENTANSKYSGYYFYRKEKLAGKLLNFGDSGSVRILRLGKKDKGRWNRTVHEEWIVKGRLGQMKNPIIHNSGESFTNFINKLNRYSSLHAVSNKNEHKGSELFKIIFFPILKFSKSWVYNLGFLDGTRGFLLSFFMSFHSFLSWSKQWSKQNTK